MTQQSRNLGLVVSAIHQNHPGLNGAQEDLDLFHAPGECSTIVWSAAAKRERRILAEFGFASIAELEDELLAVGVSERWMHFNLHAIGDLQS